MDDISRASGDQPRARGRRPRDKGPTEGGESRLSEEALSAMDQVIGEAAPADPPPLSDPAELSRVLLAVLLVSREAVSRLRLAQVCGASQSDIDAGLEVLQESLRSQGFPLEVNRVGDSVRLLTLPDVFPYLEKLRGVKKAERLSAAALETLAVIAYRQPTIRAEIEAIRGVKVGPTLRTLLDHKLIDVVGRADVPGRPLQYGTTQHFLDRFGLASVKHLPSVAEFKSI